MRIRFKKWARPELEASKFYIDNPEEYKGKWETLFKNKAPIHLELGCGKGGFISQIAPKNLNRNYIAIDLVDAMLGLAKRKYEEELRRNDIINTKAGFLLTAISILIGTIVTLLCCSAENAYKDYKLVNCFAIMVLVLLVFGFIMTVLSQIFYKRNHNNIFFIF